MKSLLKKPDNFTDRDYIEFLQRWILVNSWIYYEKDYSVVADKNYDLIAYHLVGIQKEYKEDLNDTLYGYVFYDFDGTTGFDLFHRLSESDKKRIISIALSVMKNEKADRRKNNR